MKGSLQIGLLVLVLAIGFGLARQFFPSTEIIVKEKEIPINLTTQQLDSLELAFQARLQAHTTTRIIRVSVEDTSKIRSMLNEILTLRDSLQGQAELLLTYDGEIGKYRDSLKVVADFIAQTIDISFRPNPREFTVTILDTVEIRTGDSFFTDLVQIAAGVAGGYLMASFRE